MTYQVLARKWRPKNFAEVVGQIHVVKVLQNALIQSRLHHAYLFTGTRGVGKTTLARIFAKCLNCEGGITSMPCGQCDACREIDEGKFIDLIEVDAASRTKVEDTRELLDNVQYLPGRGRFKVYLIDEVHMLSGHSFNALLKTLEEPPTHVKFLLATTDPQKLPITVLSRCLQFNLKALQPEVIEKQIRHVLEGEQINYDDEAIKLLAVGANGSVRDALSLLDQAISFGHGSVTVEETREMLGTIDATKVMQLLVALANGRADEIIEVINELYELGVDFLDATNEILEILHCTATLQLVPSYGGGMAKYGTLITDLAAKLSKEDVQLYYQIALRAKGDLPLAPTPKFGFEMMLMRMLAFCPETTEPLTMAVPAKIMASKVESNARERRLEQSGEEKAAENIDTFDLQALKITGAAHALLQYCVVSKLENQEVKLLLDPSQSPLLTKKHQERINLALNEYLGRQVHLTMEIGSSSMPTMNNIRQAASEKTKQESLEAIKNDPTTRILMDKFDAQLIEDTITIIDT